MGVSEAFAYGSDEVVFLSRYGDTLEIKGESMLYKGKCVPPSQQTSGVVRPWRHTDGALLRHLYKSQDTTLV
jgi:hypothetical protein